MYIGNGSDKLGKDFLDFLHWYRPMAEQVIVQLIPYYNFSETRGRIDRVLLYRDSIPKQARPDFRSQ